MLNKSLLPYIVGAVIAALAGLDYLLLKGDVVYETQIKATRSEPLAIDIDRLDEKHTLILRTGGKIPLEWRLVGPEGTELVNERDSRSKQGIRRSTFIPFRQGRYLLSARYRGAGGSEWSIIHVSVLVNDRRTISAWLDL